MSVEEFLKHGHYDAIHPNVTSEHFPTEKKGKIKVSLELIAFNRRISTNEVFGELDRMSYRPAELRELLVFGAKYPEIQREFLIVALGSIWQNSHGDRFVPFLAGDNALYLLPERIVYLAWIGPLWVRDDIRNRFDHFAVVRK